MMLHSQLGRDVDFISISVSLSVFNQRLTFVTSTILKYLLYDKCDLELPTRPKTFHIFPILPIRTVSLFVLICIYPYIPQSQCPGYHFKYPLLQSNTYQYLSKPVNKRSVLYYTIQFTICDTYRLFLSDFCSYDNPRVTLLHSFSIIVDLFLFILISLLLRNFKKSVIKRPQSYIEDLSLLFFSL